MTHLLTVRTAATIMRPAGESEERRTPSSRALWLEGITRGFILS